MSIIEYRESQFLECEGSFNGLLMEAMRKADTDNLEKLKAAFPEVWAELQQRYNAPGGALNKSEEDWLLGLYEERGEEEVEEKE